MTAEFRKFLRCGVLAHGFARVRRAACAFERLVPFSCKGRGFCPSCGGRRMAERATHLVEHVLPPDVPVRQWVLSRVDLDVLRSLRVEATRSGIGEGFA